MSRKNITKNGKTDADFSPVNWYATSILLRFEFASENLDNPKRRCLAWENYHILNAKSPNEAYKKAVKLGKSHEDKYKNTDGEIVRQIFEGLTMLVPIYENLVDGAEIGWTEHKNKSVTTIKNFVKSKDELEVFQRN